MEGIVVEVGRQEGVWTGDCVVIVVFVELSLAFVRIPSYFAWRERNEHRTDL